MLDRDYFPDLPPYFSVGWCSYKFESVKKLKDEAGTACFGIADFAKFTIQLDSSMRGEIQKLTIIHECMHCIFETMGLGAPAEGEDTLLTSNEIITETSSRAFLFFRYLNPELWNLLFNE